VRSEKGQGSTFALSLPAEVESRGAPPIEQAVAATIADERDQKAARNHESRAEEPVRAPSHQREQARARR
jgi:hypothetical protein